MTILDSTLQGNVTEQGGGGLANFAEATISNTLFQDNYAAGYGGGLLNVGVYGAAGNMVIDTSTFLGNTAEVNGGGLDNNGVLVITGSQFGPTDGGAGGNYAGSAGGAIGNGGVLSISDTAITFNTASGNAGGVFNTYSGGDFPSELSMTGVTLQGNQSLGGWGGALSNFGMATISDATFSGNSAANGGGAIDNYVGTMAIDHSSLDNNVAGTAGGAIHNVNSAYLQISDSSVTNNTSSDVGGGIASWSGPVVDFRHHDFWKRHTVLQRRRNQPILRDDGFVRLSR